MIVRHALRQATAVLTEAGCETPRLDAEVLLMHVLHLNRAQLLARLDDALAPEQAAACARVLARRRRREPVAYIVGEKEFWSRPFWVNADVLIPRPESEHLIEAVLEHCSRRDLPWTFCDIGTGSGCLAVILACEYPQAKVTATDISAAALTVARQNALRHGVEGRIRFCRGDMFAALPPGRRFDAIVCNPPYIAARAMAALAPELAFEPAIALTDNADGSRYHRLLLANAAAWLKPGGLLLVEAGSSGVPQAAAGLERLRSIRDLAGFMRVGVYRAQTAAGRHTAAA